jgi:Concanavalin A-like lectin/glucanases superfamily
MEVVALAGAGLLMLGGIAWFSSTTMDPSSVQIQTATQSGKVSTTSNASLPRSFNQSEGATFTFEGWFDVNDFTYGFGTRRLIFSHGDCPGLYLDTTSNSILVMVETYGATESVLISNIPAQKWVHFAIVVTQYTVDIYINGTLRQHHTLTQLPKQSDTATTIGSNNGFDGQIGGLTYYSRALSAIEVSAHAMAPPPSSLVVAPASGQYLDSTWYTGR